MRTIPLEDEKLDVIYMIAALHNFPDIERTFSELCRVLKRNGVLICGIEPNRRMTVFMDSLKRPFRKTASLGSSSPADEEAEGFTEAELLSFANTNGLIVDGLSPVWFLSGFVHYGLEFLFRLLKPTKRIRLLVFVDKILVVIDEFILGIPFMRKFSWHYTVTRHRCAA